ncbi:hypothetical protein AVEN_244721-1 [Araneus ventricosus]|uniref:Uncharacterized protein n=1 Tax=Araneus ventricosus TaxID=182803 RepID=A0A4Y2BUE2_ARAVE|nr:hypothetical protein AVEN_244721-1 [Araneus ventricosus]
MIIPRVLESLSRAEGFYFRIDKRSGRIVRLSRWRDSMLILSELCRSTRLLSSCRQADNFLTILWHHARFVVNRDRVIWFGLESNKSFLRMGSRIYVSRKFYCQLSFQNGKYEFKVRCTNLELNRRNVFWS